MKKIIIIGGGGISKVVSAMIDEDENMELIGFLDDYKEIGTIVDVRNEKKVLGNIHEYSKYLDDSDVYFYIAFAGFNNPTKSYEQIIELNIPKEKLLNIIHPQTYIPKSYVKLGHGLLVAPFAQIGPEVEIGDYCTLLGNSFIGHNTKLEDFVHVTTNAVIGANNVIGRGTHIGTNSVTRENVKIGRNVIVGSGAVVLNDIPDNAIVVGNPAKILKYRDN